MRLFKNSTDVHKTRHSPGIFWRRGIAAAAGACQQRPAQSQRRSTRGKRPGRSRRRRMDPPDVEMESEQSPPQPPPAQVQAAGEAWSMLTRARALLEEGKPSLALQAVRVHSLSLPSPSRLHLSCCVSRFITTICRDYVVNLTRRASGADRSPR